jgi:uncharacterized membrane protein
MADRETFPCRICGEHCKVHELVPAEQVDESIADVIRKECPGWSRDSYICAPDLNRFKARYVGEILGKERDELASLEENIARSLIDHQLTARNINVEFDKQLDFGDRLSDRLADFAGSWPFIAIFAGVLFLWISVNTIILMTRAFDPYPFIFLNLVLSALAAIQAPFIIMSQNRQEARDRLHAEHDYLVNLNAETEIHQLHRKIDHLLINQGQKLLEIQKIQVELMETLSRKNR